MTDIMTAFFVHHPFTLADLVGPHLASRRKPYVVEKVIRLAKIDFENFITDLCPSRWFIEDNAALCRVDDDGIWHSIFVQQRGKKDGILVMSEGMDYPRWAAFITGCVESTENGF